METSKHPSFFKFVWLLRITLHPSHMMHDGCQNKLFFKLTEYRMGLFYGNIRLHMFNMLHYLLFSYFIYESMPTATGKNVNHESYIAINKQRRYQNSQDRTHYLCTPGWAPKLLVIDVIHIFRQSIQFFFSLKIFLKKFINLGMIPILH